MILLGCLAGQHRFVGLILNFLMVVLVKHIVALLKYRLMNQDRKQQIHVTFLF